MNTIKNAPLGLKAIYGGIVFMILLIARDYLSDTSTVDTAQNHYESGEVLQNNFRYAEALIEYNEAISLRPRFANAYRGRCSVHIQLNEYQNAVDDCDRALQLDPQLTTTFSLRCVAYAWLEDYERAEADCNRAVVWHPNLATTYNDLGRLQDQMGDYEASVESYTSAIEIAPFDSVLYYNRGSSYYEAGNYEEAIIDFEQSVEFASIYYEAHEYLITTLTLAGRTDDALLAVNEMIDYFPDETALYTIRSGLQMQTNNFESAIDDLAQRIALDETDAEAYLQLGATYQMMGQLEDAQQIYCQYLKLIENPEDYISLLVADNGRCEWEE